MTLEEFKNQRWSSGMVAIYQGEEYDIAQVDFEECLIGLDLKICEESSWVRCENIKLKPRKDRHPSTNELLETE